MLLTDLVETFGQYKTLDDFEAALFNQLAVLGFCHVTLGFVPRKLHLAPAMPRNLSNYPLAWLQRYEQEGYLYCDPAISRPLKNPHRWFIWHEAQHLNAQEQQVMDEARDFGLDIGLCMALSSQASIGMIALNWDGKAAQLAPFLKHHGSNLWKLASVAQHTAMRRFYAQLQNDYSNLLSTRELDLIRWLHEEQSMTRIADQMNLSEMSIRRKIQKICRQLNVETPLEALMTVRALGLL